MTFLDEETRNLFFTYPARHPGEVIQAWLGLCGPGWIRTTECNICRVNTLKWFWGDRPKTEEWRGKIPAAASDGWENLKEASWSECTKGVQSMLIFLKWAPCPQAKKPTVTVHLPKEELQAWREFDPRPVSCSEYFSAAATISWGGGRKLISRVVALCHFTGRRSTQLKQSLRKLRHWT